MKQLGKKNGDEERVKYEEKKYTEETLGVLTYLCSSHVRIEESSSTGNKTLAVYTPKRHGLNSS